jgi:pimeloyl-ACP methyl ester carboxylesterase
MSFVMNGETRIHYEVEGRGSPFVLAHGGTIGLEMWRELGYVDALCADHQVILIDARGHGQSDKPHEPAAYAPEPLVSDVLAVLDDLGVKQTHYLGASFGAATGIELARRAPERVDGLILLGYGKHGPLTPAEQMFHQGGLGMMGLGAAGGGEAVLGMLEGAGANISPVMREQYKSNDWDAMVALQTQFIQWPGFEDDLPRFTAKTLFVVAEGDVFMESARKCADAIPGAEFATLPGGHHGQSAYGVELVLPYVREFVG